MRKIYTAFFILLIALMLYQSEICLYYSLRGLKLWFENMIPALFPFMIVSGIIIKMDLTENLTGFISPFLQPLFRVNRNVIYGILIGFLCGFPMGAKVTVQLLSCGKITPKEAEYLLCFCNNIGPVYFVSFALPALGINAPLGPVVGMYLIPLGYGLILRYVIYRNSISKDSAVSHVKQSSENKGFLAAMDEAVNDGIAGIVVLGGYMIIFNALNMLPHICMPQYASVLSPLLEITGGIKDCGSFMPFYILCLLPLGGLSCLAQTYSIIAGTGLKFGQYLLHKIILTIITVLLYHFFL